MSINTDASLGLFVRHIALQFGIFAFFLHPVILGKSIRGGELRFMELSRRFRRMGIDVWALEGMPSLKGGGLDVAYKCLEVSRTFRSFPYGIRDLSIALYITRVVLKHFKLFPFNIVYVNTGLLANVLPAYIVSRLLRRPLVTVFMGIDPEDLNSRFSDRVRSRMRDHFSFPVAVLRSLLDLLRWVIYRKAEACLAVSESTAVQAAKRFNINHMYVTGCGVDIPQPNRSESRAPKQYHAAYCGSLEAYKGTETLLHVWKGVTVRLPSARLLLVGGAMTQSTNSRYVNMVKELKLEDNVVFAGHVPHDEVSKLLTMTEVFVFPSKAEGFGLVVAEAMVCGLPCVISDIPALRENFGEVAMLVKPDDTEGFVEAITMLLRDEGKRQALGLLSKEYVKKFSWDKVAQREVEVFRKLLQKH